jgi:hypothetical protein
MGIGRMTGRRPDFAQETKSLPEARRPTLLLDLFGTKGFKGHRNLQRKEPLPIAGQGLFLFS